jgi:hypothetical protein
MFMSQVKYDQPLATYLTEEEGHLLEKTLSLHSKPPSREAPYDWGASPLSFSPRVSKLIPLLKAILFTLAREQSAMPKVKASSPSDKFQEAINELNSVESALDKLPRPSTEREVNARQWLYTDIRGAKKSLQSVIKALKHSPNPAP